jgi:TP901 family phage tail tape measure protein
MASTADLLIRLQADTAAASSQIAGVNAQLNSLGTGITAGDSMAASLQKAQPAALAMVGVGVAIGGAFAAAVTTAADFEGAISAIKSVMNPADVAIYGGAIQDLALALGRDLPITAREAALGIAELVKAGIPVSAVLGGAAESAAKLALAVGAPVAEAAALAASAMNAFRVPASELAGVMDTVAAVVNASAIDFRDLQFGLQMVAPVAAMVGLSFGDTATALGLFANNGLRGSDAGTSLKTMLMNLTPATDKASAMMQELGIITATGANQFFDASGKMKDMASVAEVLQTATAGLTEEQKLLAFRVMFGSDAIRAAAILSREGAEGFNVLAASMEGMTVAEMFRIRMDNLNGSMENLKGSVEVAAITVGNLFLPTIRSVVDWLTQAVNWFLKLDPAIIQVVAVVGAVAGAFALLLGGAVLLAPGIIAVVNGFGAMASIAGTVIAALGSILIPIGLIAAAVGALYLTWTDQWGKVASVLEGAWARIQPGLQAIWDRLAGLAGQITASLAAAWAAIDWSAVWARAVGITASITAWLSAQWAAIDWSAVWRSVTGIGATIATSLGSIAATVTTWLAGQWASINWAQVWGAITSVFTGVASIATQVTTWLAGQWSSINWATVWGAATNLFAGVASITTQVTTWLGQQWAGINWPAVWGTVTNLFAGVTSIATQVTTWLAGQWALINWGQVWGAVTSLFTGVASIATQVTTWLATEWGTVNWGQVWASATTLGSKLLSSGLAIAADVAAWLSVQWSAIDWGAIWATATTIGSKFLTGVGTIVGSVTAWLQVQWASVDWAQVWSQVRNIGNGLDTQIATLTPQAQAGLGDVWSRLNWPDIWSRVIGFDRAMAAWIKAQPVEALGTAIGEWIGRAIIYSFVTLPGVLPNLGWQLGQTVQRELAKGPGLDGNALGSIYFPTATISAFLNSAARLLGGIGTGIVDALLSAMGTDRERLATGFETFMSSITDLPGRVLNYFRTTYIDPLTTAFASLGLIVSTIATHFTDFGSALSKITLPWFLTPGSPTPMEQALSGILDVVLKLVAAGNPLAWLDTLMNWLTGGATGGLGGSRTVNITGNTFIIRSAAEGEELVLALEEAFRVLLAGADGTEGASPSLAGAG